MMIRGRKKRNLGTLYEEVKNLLIKSGQGVKTGKESIKKSLRNVGSREKIIR